MYICKSEHKGQLGEEGTDFSFSQVARVSY